MGRSRAPRERGPVERIVAGSLGLLLAAYALVLSVELIERIWAPLLVIAAATLVPVVAIRLWWTRNRRW